MSDDTIYPPSMYPGGSEAEFNALRRELEQVTTERDALRLVIIHAHGLMQDQYFTSAHSLLNAACKSIEDRPRSAHEYKCGRCGAPFIKVVAESARDKVKSPCCAMHGRPWHADRVAGK